MSDDDKDIDELSSYVRRQAIPDNKIPRSLRDVARVAVHAAGCAEAERFVGHPHIVCLCGSTRFHDEFQRANYALTMEGKIVLSVGFFVHGLSDTELIAKLIKTADECNVQGFEWKSAGFWRTMLATMRGAHSENVGCTPEQKEKLDDLHLRKIDLCDEVRVLNKGGYIGSSTQRELAYAIMLDRRISFLDDTEGRAYLADEVKRRELSAHITTFQETKR
jgi:hypothetical protein